jgi:hypothetical protein
MPDSSTPPLSVPRVQGDKARPAVRVRSAISATGRTSCDTKENPPQWGPCTTEQQHWASWSGVGHSRCDTEHISITLQEQGCDENEKTNCSWCFEDLCSGYHLSCFVIGHNLSFFLCTNSKGLAGQKREQMTSAVSRLLYVLASCSALMEPGGAKQAMLTQESRSTDMSACVFLLPQLTLSEPPLYLTNNLQAHKQNEAASFICCGG